MVICPFRAIRLTPDLWDLGEFNQKGTTRTKYGTIDELKGLAKVAQEKGVSLYFDAVLNHKASADTQQECKGIQVDWDGCCVQVKTDD
jgi:alpha-amylase